MRKLRTSLTLVSPLRSYLTAGLPLTALLVATPAWAQEDPTADPATEAAPDAEAATAEPAPEAEAAPAVAPPPAEGKSEATASATVSAGGGGGVVQMGDSGRAGGPAGGGHVQTMGGGLGSALAGGPVPDSDDEWKFDYHGYMRAPMRIGIGERANAKTNQSVTTLSIPQIPTDQYIDWQYTQSAPRSTAEMFFSYGNSIVRGVASIQAFRLSDSSFIDPTLQSGVTLAWVEVTPDLSDIIEDMRMNAKVGSFWSRYGGAGQYDAGAYETFVIGRTHTIGENIRIEYDYNDFVWFFEEGFGTKQPDPSPFHSIKYTLIGHAHAGFNWDQFLDVGLHYMHAWTQEQDHECINDADEVLQNNPDDEAGLPLFARYAEAPVGACKQDQIQVETETFPQLRADSPDGSLQVIGADFVFNTSMAGRLFVGASHIIAKHAVTVAPAIEVIHAFGGGFFKSGVTHQYLNERDQWDAAYDSSRGKDGNGTISTLALQWDLSIASLIELPQQLDLTAFGMLNLIKSEDDPALKNISKLKYGADLVWGPLSWFAAGFRFDRLQPRSDIPEQSFTVLAPRLIFRSDFATHEEITIGYARYLYAQRECTGYKAPFRGSAPTGFDQLRNCVQPPNATIAPEGFANRPGVTGSKGERGGPIDVESVRGGFPDIGWTAPHEQVFYVSADIWW